MTGYNNYYEFGTGKDDPARNVTRSTSRPWKVEVAGEVKRPAVYDFDELLKPFTPAERVYRMRCVEGWSMVVPWLGIPLGAVIDRLEPTSKARCEGPGQACRLVLEHNCTTEAQRGDESLMV